MTSVFEDDRVLVMLAKLPIDAALEKANQQRRVNLTMVGEPRVYADVERGRTPSGIPITGSHEMSGKFGDQLDRSSMRLSIVFELSGSINGVEFERYRVWITGHRVELPTLSTATSKARAIFYEIGRAVRDDLGRSQPVIEGAWRVHLRGLLGLIEEREEYLRAVRENITGQLAAKSK